MIPDRLLLAASSGKTLRIIWYRAAAWVYGLDGVPNLLPEFAVPHGSWHRGPYDHQRRRIDDLEIVEVDGVLITSVSQTLVDLCAVVDLDIVERAAESALRMRLVDEMRLRDFAYVSAFYRRGVPGLLEVLDRRPIGARPTGSDLETRYLQVVRGEVRTPERQFDVVDPVGELAGTADFGFPPIPFVVETDGFATHGRTAAQQQYDLNRQNRISDAGYDFRRFTHGDVVHRPAYVVRETRRGLLIATLTKHPLRCRI
jgi:very-short-patch-repair endonuclease